jgi:hypothetical protein
VQRWHHHHQHLQRLLRGHQHLTTHRTTQAMIVSKHRERTSAGAQRRFTHCSGAARPGACLGAMTRQQEA